MPFRCSIYGLGVVANRNIPGIPSSQPARDELRINFGSLPAWLDQSDALQIENTFTSDYQAENGSPVLRVFRLLAGGYYKFCYTDGTEFVIDRAGTEVWSNWPESLTLEDATTYLLGPIMGFVMLLRGVVCLHASAIAVGRESIAVVGPAGSGKSTTAAAFVQRGFKVLAEDVATLEDRGDRFLVRPAYPGIRLWPPSVRALYGSESCLPTLTPNWDKRYLDLTEQFQQESLPLTGIYLLDRRSDDSHAPLVEPLNRAEGLMALVANTYATKLMDKEMRAREFELLTRVLGNVPLRRVTPHTDPARIGELCDCILDDFHSTRGSARIASHV